MRWPRTLSLYVAREIFAYTLLGLAAISVVMVTRSLVRVLDELINTQPAVTYQKKVTFHEVQSGEH